jgi:cephalosporin-C deacetylase-like acetyl esterase
LQHERLDPSEVQVQPEGLTVEENWLLDLYTLLHSKHYQVYRLRFPDSMGEEGTAHLMLPEGEGPHPTIVVFPILAGSHVVSEALAKALVNRRYGVLRLERRELPFETSDDPQEIADQMAAAVRDGRRMLDFLESRPDVDPQRIGTAGVSLGSMLACVLQGVDSRVRAGFFALTGGGMAEVLYDSGEKPVRAFRDRIVEQHSLATREEFLAFATPFVGPIDPLSYAERIPNESVLMVSGRFDRVIPPERSQVLWEALNRPSWTKLPTGHYQAMPFLWYAANLGADHFDRVLAPPAP